MIRQFTKPTYVVECDACGSRDPLEYDEPLSLIEQVQLEKDADKAGYFRLFFHLQTMSHAERKNKEFTICLFCLQKICGILSQGKEQTNGLWDECTVHLSKGTLDALTVAERVTNRMSKQTNKENMNGECGLASNVSTNRIGSDAVEPSIARQR